MMSDRWTLKLEMIGPHGERYAMAIGIGSDIANDIAQINPPMRLPFGLGDTFESTVRILRRKDLRKDLFRSEATRLGILLAERMEDAEGWHDASRIEPAKRQIEGIRTGDTPP